MPSFFTRSMMRMRLVVSFLTIVWLGLAALASASARLADVLQNRAKSDFVHTDNLMLDITFQKLMSNILVSMVITALISTVLFIFGILLSVHSRWLQEDCNARIYYGCLTFLMSICVISIGGYAAGCIHGFQSSFELFSGESSFPYYAVIYYGAVGQATFASALFILILVHVVAAA
ncbi:uncharacterized protein N7511_011233 [Penicillium nucicola]|uniref:uncharacterized protein n=1 Tax=Penicillium nucicola TaxID=1850975 RepID=UPI0025454BE4|nr:uncharacterized protein N7511_011233 [Penicillium nucicola]KAJ5742662.1 hypothetical protein N7511_011233 [Penicillium nucicola]